MNRALAVVVGIALCAVSVTAARADQMQDAVKGFAVQEYTATFYAGQDSRVVLQSIGGTYLIVEVHDAAGNLVGRDTDKNQTAVVAWIPLWTDKYTIRVTNPSSLPNTYVLATK